jgi:hypothetical protein
MKKCALFLAIIFSSFQGCQKEDIIKEFPDGNDCVSFMKNNTVEIELPEKGKVNQIIPVTVSFWGNSGCSSFSKFEDKIENNTIEISVIMRNSGCVCTEQAPRFEEIYNFKPEKAGVYRFKYMKSNDVFDYKNITIE